MIQPVEELMEGWNLLRVVVDVFLLRLSCTVAWALSSRRVPRPAKLVLLGLGFSILLLAYAQSNASVLWMVGGILYYAALTVGTWALVGPTRTGRLTSGGILVLTVAGYVALPAILLPGVAAATFLILGWSFALSAYSFVVEHRQCPNPALSHCLFFVLVDPTLSYPDRSREVGMPVIHWRGLGRSLWGLAVFLGAGAFLVPLVVRVQAEPTRFGVASFLAAWIVCKYAQHSALASLQIGAMRQLGYTTPECYRYPFLAVSPLDFWRRWNRYLGDWVRRYVYAPLALHIARRAKRLSPVAATGAAVEVTFMIVGCLHFGYAYFATLKLETPWLVWFAGQGILLLAWAGAESMARALAVPPLAKGALMRACFLLALGTTTQYIA